MIKFKLTLQRSYYRKVTYKHIRTLYPRW